MINYIKKDNEKYKTNVIKIKIQNVGFECQRNPVFT
jgi:hypothetical protein